MGLSAVARKVSLELTTRWAGTITSMRAVTAIPKPPRDHRGTHFSEAVRRQLDTGLYLQLCSSGGGTRTHNLRINSPLGRSCSRRVGAYDLRRCLATLRVVSRRFAVSRGTRGVQMPGRLVRPAG